MGEEKVLAVLEPLEKEGSLAGPVGVDNPSVKKTRGIGQPLSMLSGESALAGLGGPYRAPEEDPASAAGNPLLQEYNMLMSSMRVSVSKHLLHEDFPLVWANNYFYAMNGYTKEEFKELFHGSSREYFANDREEYDRLCRAARAAFESGKPGYEVLLNVPCKGGTHIWVQMVSTFTEERVDGLPVVFAVITNVNDLVRMQKEQMVMYDNLPGFVAKIRIGPTGPHILYENKKLADFFGEKRPGEERESIRKALADNREVIAANSARMRLEKFVSFEAKVQSAAGRQAYLQVYGDCVDHIQGDPVYLFLFFDVTEITEQRASLYRLAFEDPITGGRNRTSFELDAGGAVRAAPPNTYALVSVDIQKFKVINDLFGIDAGDRTLRYIYWKLVEQLRPGEYAARLSSDTFSILFQAEQEEQLKKRLEGLATQINSFNEKLERKYLLFIMAGIYYVDDPTLPMTHLQDRANVARKKIRDKTGMSLCRCRFYNNGDRLLLAREKDIENKMEDALRAGQFIVYLQPKQDLRTGEVAGAEALVRWRDPQEGLMQPEEFINLFERNGFIVELDLYVFEQVCGLLRGWLDKGLRAVPISVNMSRVHLRNLGGLYRYEKIRRRYGIPAELLEIEVTESVVLENPALLVRVIDELHGYGFRCSMDDFGNGYSSLNVLKDIRVDTLKLDRAFFTSQEMDNPWEAAIVSGVVELARKLQMRTVAEGVETPAQADFLREVGCDQLQGYLFSKPVAPELFEALVFPNNPNT